MNNNKPERAPLHVATIEATAELAERIAARLEDAEAPSALAVSQFECGRRRVEVTAYYEEEPSREALLAALAGLASQNLLDGLVIAALPERDWVREAEAQRPPVRAGRFLVHGRHDRDRVPRTRMAIEIDAGLAFGTGAHASTKGCLIALDRLLKRRRPKAILDIGTGTGILAIAAAKASRATAIAGELDPPVVAAAKENVRLAGVERLVRVIEAAGLDHPALRGRKADLLMANILLGPLLTLAPDFSRAVRTGGICVLSGLLQSQARQVEARYRAFGFRLEARLLIDGWATLVLVKRA